jgi:hypothetical protein
MGRSFKVLLILLIFSTSTYAQTQCGSTETFTYSNGALSTASAGVWTKPSGFADMQVNTNAITAAGADAYNVITTWVGSTSNQYAQVVVTTPSTDGGGPVVKGDAVNNAYVGHTGGSPAIEEVYLVSGGGFTIKGNGGGTVIANDVFYIEVQSNVIIAKRNGTLSFSFSDSTIATGKPGVYGFDNAHRLDTWQGGDFSGCGGASITLRMGLMGVGP